MTLKKPMPLILLLFTIMCVLPAATTTAVIPSAIAQEDDDMSLDEAENLASDTVSNVLDNGNNAGDDSNTQIVVPLIDQDQDSEQRAENRAANLDLEVIREQPLTQPLTQPPGTPGGPAPTPPPTTPEVLFCFQYDFIIPQTGFMRLNIAQCGNTLEECLSIHAQLSGNPEIHNLSQCGRFEKSSTGTEVVFCFQMGPQGATEPNCSHSSLQECQDSREEHIRVGIVVSECETFARV